MRFVADFDPSTPSIARVYDYLNGGKDNFAADRELAQRLIDIFPPITVTVTENKRFLDLAVELGRGAGDRPVHRHRLRAAHVAGHARVGAASACRTPGWRTSTSTRSC